MSRIFVMALMSNLIYVPLISLHLYLLPRHGIGGIDRLLLAVVTVGTGVVAWRLRGRASVFLLALYSLVSNTYLTWAVLLVGFGEGL